MEITQRHLLLTLLVAAGLHVLALAAFWMTGPNASAPDATPEGIMVSLESLDAGPPPTPSVPETPEATTPQAPETTAPEPAAAPTPAEPADTSSAPDSASPVGPEPAEAPVPEAAGPKRVAPAAAVPAEATPVTIRPSDTVAAVEPQERTTAHTPQIQASAQPAEETGNGASGSSEQATDDYITRTRAWLSRHKQYPQRARQKALEGTVKLYIVIGPDGRVISHRIEQSSGHALLDQAAERMLARAEPLPSMPAAMQRNRLELVVPIVFTLR